MSRESRTGWRRVAAPPIMQGVDLRCYQKEVADGHLTVLVGPEPDGWHLSISHRLSDGTRAPGRLPTWDEIHEARYEFCPDRLHMAMILPPKEEYVNVHSTTMHLWEWPD